MEKMYGFSSASSLAINTSAVRAPGPPGWKVIWNVVVPPPDVSVEAGALERRKSPALAPEISTRPAPVRYRSPEPELTMVNARTTVPPVTSAGPKSVPSSALGLASPLAMETPLPCTSISGTPVTWMWTGEVASLSAGPQDDKDGQTAADLEYARGADSRERLTPAGGGMVLPPPDRSSFFRASEQRLLPGQRMPPRVAQPSRLCLP